jgi:hypothetical protein
VRVFHVELRQFPRNAHAFNLSRDELIAAVLAPWRQGGEFKLAEQSWRPGQAHLTILEGPRLETHQLAMGRGWPAALKQGADVTDALLRDGTATSTGEHAPAPPRPVSAASLAAFKRELLVRSAEQPSSLPAAWQLASRWLPSHPVSERLALAERAVIELLAQGLCTLGRGTAASAGSDPVPREDQDAILRAWETWGEQRAGVFLCVTAAGVASTEETAPAEIARGETTPGEAAG